MPRKMDFELKNLNAVKNRFCGRPQTKLFYFAFFFFFCDMAKFACNKVIIIIILLLFII